MGDVCVLKVKLKVFGKAMDMTGKQKAPPPVEEPIFKHNISNLFPHHIETPQTNPNNTNNNPVIDVNQRV